MQGRKVIIFHWHLVLGGAERQSLHLARYLRQQCDADVEVWGTWQNGNRLTRIYEEAKVGWRIVPVAWPATRWGRLSNVVNLARLLRRARPDVTLPYTDAPNVLCGNAWRWSSAKVCVWNQRSKPILPRTRLVRRALGNVSAIVANSAHAQNALVQDYGVQASKIRFIRNGVEPSQAQATRECWRSKLGVAANAFLAVMVGHLSTRKDHATLLQAWRRVLDHSPKPHLEPQLLLAGEFQEATAKVQATATALGLDNHVRFLGPVEDVAGLLQAADLFTFGAKAEGCPNGVLEAMAAGLAVVATDDAGVREAVGPGGYQLLAPPKDPERLARLILAAMSDPELRARCGAANRQRIEQEFSVTTMCRNTVEVIEDAWQQALPARATFLAVR